MTIQPSQTKAVEKIDTAAVRYLNGPPTHMVRPSEYWKKVFEKLYVQIMGVWYSDG